MPTRRTEAPTPGTIDRDGLARLYDRYARGLYRYAAVVLMDHGLAEDAVQQVFSRLLTTRRVSMAEPEHYLRRAVRNECLTLIDRKRVGPVSAPILEPVDHRQADPEERLMIEAALRALPIDQREVVVLKIYEGLTFSEISQLVEAPVNTVASRYRYAVEKLKAILTAEGCSK